MNNVVQFVPRTDRDAKMNLNEFIRMAREDLTAFEEGGAWNSDRWQHGRTVALFSAKQEGNNSYSYTPLADPFKQFAKAYVRYTYSHHPVVSFAMLLQGLRCIEAALLDCCGCADVLMLRGAVMDTSAQKCREFYVSKDVWHKTGLMMQRVFDFCRTNRLAPSLPQWKSPFKKPAILTEVVGQEGQAHRNAKLPSNATMLMLADLFAAAEDTETRYFTSIMILLMAAPSRISEVLALPVDCIVWDEDYRGERQMYLRWRAAKGKGPMKKWVIPAMHSAVEEAVRRLVEIGEPGRHAAKFAFDNPGKFMRHPRCTTSLNFPEDGALGPDEFCAAIGVSPGRSTLRADGSNTWSQVVVKKELRPLVESGKPTYSDLGRAFQAFYRGADWPFINATKAVKTWEALCIHRDNEFHKDFPVKHFSWRQPTANDINARLQQGANGLSLFERSGMRNLDGTSIKVTTHQLRHWLSTMSERAGMDDYTLAQWAGRADQKHNRHYDHRTAEEQLDAAREIVLGEKPSLLERIKNRQAVTYNELGVDRLGTAKATLYGMCVHDYAMAPCQKQRECMTCKEHVCIKGDHVTLDRIKVLEEQTALMLERAQHAHEDGIFGADRWVDNHKWKLAHVKAMRMSLEHPEVPDGAILRIPEGHDPSPVQRTLMDLGVTPPPTSEPVALPVLVKALPGGGDA